MGDDAHPESRPAWLLWWAGHRAREPELVQSFLAYPEFAGVRGKEHTVIGKQSAYAVGISAQPGFFIFFVHHPDLAEVFKGKHVLGEAEERTGEQESEKQRVFCESS